MAHIEIAACKKPDDNYHVEVTIFLDQSFSESHLVMTRDELKEIRNMLHNVLLDLNLELNYED